LELNVKSEDIDIIKEGAIKSSGINFIKYFKNLFKK